MKFYLLNGRLPSHVLVGLCLLLCHIAAAQATAPQEHHNKEGKKVTINMDRAPINNVLRKVVRQAHIGLFISTETEEKLSERISLNVTNKSIEQVLKQVLEANGWYYFMDGDVLHVPGNKLPVSIKGSSDSTAVEIVTGKVTDLVGIPVPFATVMIKGTKDGVLTDTNGIFTLRTGKKSGLIVSSIGFETKELTVFGKKPMLVQLTPWVNRLNETVVTGYGIITRRMNTGNVATIKAKDIEKQPVSNLALALQGKVPGLSIQQSTGLSGSNTLVRSQGDNSLKNGNDPLYIIDGVPYPSQLLNTFTSILGGLSRNAPDVATQQPGAGSPLSFINLHDVESIDVLKDADATSIYGSRGSNAVILITTKRGKPGPIKTDVMMQYGIGMVASKVKVLNTPQYVEMRQQAFKNAGWSVPQAVTAENADLTVYSQYRNTDWQKVLLGNRAQYANVNATVYGGTDYVQFLLSLGRREETTVFPGNLADQRTSAHFNMHGISVNKCFQVNFSGIYMMDNNQLISTDLTELAIKLVPNAPEPYGKNHELNWALLPNGNASWKNPLAYLQQPYNNKTANLVASASVSYCLLPGLCLRTNGGYNNLGIKEMLLLPQNSYAPQDREGHPGEAKIANGDISTWIIEPQVEYVDSLGEGTLDVFVGSTLQGNTATRTTIITRGYAAGIPLPNIGAALQSKVSSNSADYKYNALFMRLSYNWHNKYIFNLSARRDGSSRFGPANRFHNFGSVAGAWVFSESSWLKQWPLAMSFGKLKSSYGTTGNDAIGDYQFMNFYQPVSSPLPYQGGIGLEPTSLTNSYLQWEQTRKLSAGLELGFFQDRLLLDVNYYQNRSANQLLNYPIPVATGFPNIMKNIDATVLNAGWELSISFESRTNQDIQWSSRLNLTIPVNKLLAYPGLELSENYNDYVIGQSTNVRRLYRFAGVDTATGLYRVYDQSGNRIAAEFTGRPEDKTSYINLNPVLYGGVSQTFKYKGFELNVLFYFVKQKGGNYALGFLPGTFYGGIGNQPAYILNHWEKRGENKPVQQVNSDVNSLSATTYVNAMASTAAFSDASYVRLKQLLFAWTLPEYWQQKLHMQARLFFEGQNLFTITGYQGLDPETRNTTSLPPLRMFTVGIGLTL